MTKTIHILGFFLIDIFVNTLHISIQMHAGASPLIATRGIFSIGYPAGLIWGY